MGYCIKTRQGEINFLKKTDHALKSLLFLC